MRSEIISLLPASYPWGSLIEYYPTLDSTNTRLKKMAMEGAPHGTVLIAGQQTGGRGRMGRSFLSPEGMGVYLSILLRPECAARDLMHLTCATAVAMCDALEAACGFRPGIKWTNDLVFGKGKLGGILTELGLRPDGTADYCVIGIGINCSQKAEDFSPEIRDMALSLSTVRGEAVSPAAVAAEMLKALRKMSEQLLSHKEQILEQYRKDCITLGQDVAICSFDGTVRYATAVDITPEGALVVRFADGHEEEVNSGEVSVRGMYGYL